MKTKKTRARRDPAYSAAWSACGKPFPGEDPEQNDLRTKLDGLLKAGWSIQALYSFASIWRPRRYERVTPATWRLAVELASLDLLGSATEFLGEFNKRHAPANDCSVQAVGIAA
jgi:hypothetical protein